MPRKPTTPTRHLVRSRPLRVEALERRQLLAADILVSGIDAPSHARSNHATVSLIDLRDGEVSPIVAASVLQTGSVDANEGISGLAILRDGTLVTAVSTRVDQAPAAASELVVRASLEGPVLRRVDVRLAGSSVAIADLTTDAARGRVLGVTADSDNPTATARLIDIDPLSGVATLIGDTGLKGRVSIAMHPDGTLYATSQDGGFSPLTLHRIDATDASVIESHAIIDHTPYGLTTGLAVNPDTGLLYGSESHLGRFFTIDPVLFTRTFLSTQSPLRGVTGDLAFSSRRDSDDVRQLFFADFNQDASGFTMDNSGGDIAGLWHRSYGRRDDNLLNHSRSGSFYYGLFEGPTGGGSTIVDRYHRGVISSPHVTLPAEGTSILSFSYLLDTRPELTHDFVTVSIDDGTTVTPILSRAAGTLPETAGDWLTATYDVSAYAGQTISIDFEYDSGDPVRVDPEGWYVDDVIIVHLADPLPLTANLFVDKTVDDDTPNENQSIVYTITAGSAADSVTTAFDVLVTDVLPAGVMFQTSTPSVGRFDPVTGKWSGFKLAPGETQTLKLQVFVAAGTVGNLLTNVVDIQSELVDPDISDNDKEQRSIVNSVDLAAEKRASNEAPMVGDSVTFEIEVSNIASNAVATGVTLVDVLPVGLTFVSASDGGIYDGPTRTITWNLANLTTGDLQKVSLIASVDAGTAGLSLTNLARVIAIETDPDPTNNESTKVITPVPALADLSVLKNVDDDTPNENQMIVYTITAGNAATSASTATGVLVTDTLPTGVTLDSFAVSEGSFDPITGIWSGLELIPGESQVLTLSVIVHLGTSGDELVNIVTIDADQDDPKLGDNRATQTSTVNRVDLSAKKSVDNQAPTEGEQVKFEILVTNSGFSNAVATGVTVVDELPIGLSLDRASTSGVYNSSTREITWSLSDILIGGSQMVSYTASVDAGTANTPLTNLAQVISLETDPDPSNNTDTKTVTPQPIPTQTVQFLTPLSVFRASTPVLPAASQLALLGYVWHDANADGIWDASESGISGATVSLFQNGDLFGTTQTRSLDVDGNGVIDPDTERGVYFFENGVAGVPNGTYTVRVDIPSGVNTSSPITGTVAVTVDSNVPLAQRPIGQPRQPSATETSATNFGISQDFVNSPSSSVGTIIGYSWADVDMDGQWDTDEQARRGVQYFLDLNNDGVFNPESNEPTSTTDDEGRYRFALLAPRTYAIRELNFDRDNPLNPGGGTVLVSTFPVAEQDGVLPAHTVNVIGGSVVQAERGVATAPNFGANEIGRYVRPADVYLDWLAEYPLLQNALAATQSFTVTNTTGSAFDITSINRLNLINPLNLTNPLNPGAHQINYVSIHQVADDGTLSDPVFPIKVDDDGTIIPQEFPPISVDAESSVEFVVFFAPVRRNEFQQVLFQEPDWLASEAARSVYSFADNAMLEVITDRDLQFPVQLIGGSTYDSDINYDGRVDELDANVLNDLLESEPVIKEKTQRFDPSKDINVRCPNGADQVTNTCVFPVGGPPSREISFGDFGTINVEIVDRPQRDPIAIAVILPPTFTAPVLSTPVSSGTTAAGEPIAGAIRLDANSRMSLEPSCDAVFLSDTGESESPLVDASSHDGGAVGNSLADEIVSTTVLTTEVAWCDPRGVSTDLDGDERLRAIDEFFGMLV